MFAIANCEGVNTEEKTVIFQVRISLSLTIVWLIFVIANCKGVNKEEKLKENCYISGGHLKNFGY